MHPDDAFKLKTFKKQSRAPFSLLAWQMHSASMPLFAVAVCSSILTKNQSPSATSITVEPTTMTDSPSLALMLDSYRLNHMDDCIKTKIVVSFGLVVGFCFIRDFKSRLIPPNHAILAHCTAQCNLRIVLHDWIFTRCYRAKTTLSTEFLPGVVGWKQHFQRSGCNFERQTGSWQLPFHAAFQLSDVLPTR